MTRQTLVLLDRVRSFAMPRGPIECKGTWLRQEGELRFAPERPWLRFDAEQSFSGSGIEFRWDARVSMAPLLRARVVDAFEGGRGELVARLFGLIRVAHARGPATDVGEALRGLAELPWRPSSFASAANVAFEATSDAHLRAVFDDGETRAAVVFEIGHDGRVLRCTAPSRPRLVGDDVVDTPWSGTFDDYEVFEGVRVPTSAEVTWQLPRGPFTYWRGRVTAFELR